VKRADDLMSASRYALMMLRHAEREGGTWTGPIRYPGNGVM
jgi:hypothetical protein